MKEDKRFLLDFMVSFIKPLLLKTEEELELAKSKKGKSTQKKQKEKVASISNKIALAKKVKEKLDELQVQMEFAEGGAIKGLRGMLEKYAENPDDESNKNCVDAEVQRIMDKIEGNKRNINQNMQ